MAPTSVRFKMKLFIQHADQAKAINVEPLTTIQKLQELLGVTTLLFAGKILLSDALVAELKEDATLVAVEPIDGAGKDKKRKKKAKKTPKKKKYDCRDHKNKLGLLKLYKVTDSGVECLRKFCEKCGPGVRMSLHYNRTHCGRCGAHKPIAGGKAPKP